MNARGVALLLGLLAALLWVVGAVLAGVGSLTDQLLGRGGAGGLLSYAVVAIVLAALTLLFGLWGARRVREETRIAGVLLIVLALAEWLILRTAEGLVGTLAVLLTLLAGVLDLVAER